MKLYQVDSFTDTPFTGNPAGVVISKNSLKQSEMQNIAAEMNCSETAFLVKQKDHYSIRYFTPEQEVPLCGHATLAAASILFNEIENGKNHLLLKAADIELRVNLEDDWISMVFPKDQLSKKIEDMDAICSSLNLEERPLNVLKSRFGWHLIELKDEQTVRKVNPDFQKMKSHNLTLLITSLDNEEEFDFVSRFFAPAAGINEDPVTGLAHCSSGEYWAERLGKTELIGLQLSRREGVVKVKVEKEQNIISGQAVKTMDINIDDTHFS